MAYRRSPVLPVGDELDKSTFNLSTRTHVIDVSDLDAPVYVFPYSLGTRATDHNLYVLGNRVFEANGFQGAWSVYPYLPSGTIIVSDINSGLFILSMQ